MINFKTNIYSKIAIIIFLALLLLIPTSMIRGLIDEREATQKRAINEVSEKWASGQSIAGPFITIPYDKIVKKYIKKDSVYKHVKTREYIHILPNQLNITGSIQPEKRYRGIYEVVVYDSNIKLQGHFDNIDLNNLEINKTNVHFDMTTINVGISDLKGIENQIDLNWNDKIINFNSGLATHDIVPNGVNAELETLDTKSRNNFELTIDLKGSQYLNFLPFGKVTNVDLESEWTTPSFRGEFLPDERVVNQDGFSANWNILHLNRNYPQIWTGSSYRVRDSSFGTNLLLPVDNFKKSDRVAKYAILFIGLTFLVFFFVEILNNTFIHPIQYILVGLALVVFYTLLLSFSEHFLFDTSYFLSAFLTLGLVSLYTYSILKSKALAGLILSILTILYTFIFVIIQQEDFALLIGSLGMFIILSLVMYFSRKIDWYDLKLGEKIESNH